MGIMDSLRVLSVSSDRNFFRKKADTDVLNRHKAYAKGCDMLTVVVRTMNKEGFSPITIGNLEVLPSGGSNKIGSLYEVYVKSAAVIRKGKIDIISAQDPMGYGFIGYVLARKFGLPLSVNWHGDFMTSHPILSKLALYISKRADAVRVVSEPIKEKLIKSGVDRGKIRVIPTPVDLSVFTSASGLPQMDFGKPIVLFVGRLVALKRIDVLIRAFKSVLGTFPEATLLIAGDGDMKGEWERLSKSLGIAKSVRFLGAVPHEDLPGYYRAADMVVLPSDHEGFGKVILEAAAAGTPVLASRTSGATSIIKQDELLFNIGNERECAKKLADLLSDESLRKGAAERLKRDIESEYGWQKSVDAVINLWRSVVKNQ